MNKKIKNVTVITPVFYESLETIEGLLDNIKLVQDELLDKGIKLSHFFLDDGAINLSVESKRLIRHESNLGLAKTLLDGYKAVLGLSEAPDLVIRMDCQEHNVAIIPQIIDVFNSIKAKAVFLPISYSTDDQTKSSIQEINQDITNFKTALSPINSDEILRIYNQKLPIGFQSFKFSALKEIFKEIEKGYDLFENDYGKLFWGIDLLAILLAAKKYPDEINFLFGGWTKPWKENRSEDKAEAQRKNIENIIDIATSLGCKTA